LPLESTPHCVLQLDGNAGVAISQPSEVVSEEDENARRLRRRHRRCPTQRPEQRDLTKEIARTKRNELHTAKGDRDSAVADYEKRVPGRTRRGGPSGELSLLSRD